MPNYGNIQLALTAIKSGEFRQTQKHLRDRWGYCCLGVICEVYRRVEGKGEWGEARGDQGVQDFITPGHKSVGYMPPQVTNWLGLPYSFGDLHTSYVSPENEDTNAAIKIGGADMNDAGMTFAQIAELLEYELLSNGEPI